MYHLLAWFAAVTVVSSGLWADEPAAKPLVLNGFGSAAFSPDGTQLVTVSGSSPSYHDTVRIWDAATGKELRAIKAAPMVSQVIFSPDGTLICGTAKDKKVIVWDAATGQERRTFGPHLGEVGRVLLSPDGKLLYVVSDDRGPTVTVPNSAEIKCWATLNGAVRFVIQLPGPSAVGGAPQRFAPRGAIHGLTVSPDGKWLAGVTHDPGRIGQERPVVRVWDAVTGKEARTFPAVVCVVAFSPDSKHLAWVDGAPRQVRVREVSSGRAVADIAIDVADNDYDAVAYSPDGKSLAVKAALTVDLYDLQAGKRVHRLKQGTNVHSITFSPDGKTLAAACGGFNEIYGSKGSVKLWDVATGKLRSTHAGHRGYVERVVFSPDGKRFAAVNQVSVAVWRADQ